MDKTTKTCWSRRKYQLWILGELYYYKTKNHHTTVVFKFKIKIVIVYNGKLIVLMKKILQTTHDRNKTVSLSAPDPEYN